MTETDLTGVNPVVYPELVTWEWPVAAYLFLGGLVGGLMVLVGVLRLRRNRVFDDAVRVADLWALPLLLAGLAMLFLDLSYKLHAWRFFTAFRPSSPMSWGSWILLVAGVVLAMRLLARVPSTGWHRHRFVPLRLRRWIVIGSRLVRSRTRGLDIASVLVGSGLAFYTGILLSTIPARPLWNSVALAPLFLVSGVAAAGAFVCLFISAETHRRLIPVAISLCGVELLLIGGFMLTLGMGSDATSSALGTLFSAPYGVAFWVIVVVLGLLVPLTIETSEFRNLRVPPLLSRAAPVLKLFGSAGLRFVIVFAGLHTVL